MSPRARLILWTAMILGLLGAGTAFAFKVAEFVFTIGSEDLPGFADHPVAVYFFVAAGWLAILGWCFMTGKMRDLEQPKHDMLAREEEYERRGE
jgi:hypothetical protein